MIPRPRRYPLRPIVRPATRTGSIGERIALALHAYYRSGGARPSATRAVQDAAGAPQNARAHRNCTEIENAVPNPMTEDTPA